MQWEKKQHITVVFTDDFTDDSHLSYVHPSCCDCFPCYLLWYIVNKVIITQQASSEAWEDWKSRCQSSHHIPSFVESCTLMTSECANGWVGEPSWWTAQTSSVVSWCTLSIHLCYFERLQDHIPIKCGLKFLHLCMVAIVMVGVLHFGGSKQTAALTDRTLTAQTVLPRRWYLLTLFTWINKSIVF